MQKGLKLENLSYKEPESHTKDYLFFFFWMWWQAIKHIKTEELHKAMCIWQRSLWWQWEHTFRKEEAEVLEVSSESVFVAHVDKGSINYKAVTVEKEKEISSIPTGLLILNFYFLKLKLDTRLILLSRTEFCHSHVQKH